jgi:ATP-dependent Clp protease ATP-binding subunit ClpA
MRNRSVPTFSQPRKALHQALTLANERHHEYATLEHLLLALIDDQDAAAVMRACNVNLDELRRDRRRLYRHRTPTWSPTTTRIPSRPPASSASSSAR